MVGPPAPDGQGGLLQAVLPAPRGLHGAEEALQLSRPASRRVLRWGPPAGPSLGVPGGGPGQPGLARVDWPPWLG